jgi:hypothetical protein
MPTGFVLLLIRLYQQNCYVVYGPLHQITAGEKRKPGTGIPSALQHAPATTNPQPEQAYHDVLAASIAGASVYATFARRRKGNFLEKRRNMMKTLDSRDFSVYH